MSEVSSREFRPDLDREFQYLLGQMPRVDRETFQGLLIENAEVSERVLEAENELFDAWVRGDLPRDWRPMFEERLLSTPEGRRKATVARALGKAAARSDLAAKGRTAQGTAGTWIRRIAPIFCILFAAGLWFWWPSDDKNAESAQVETLRLQAGASVDANRPKFRIAASTTHVRFGIPEPASVPAEISTAEGKTVWKGSAADNLPASLFSSGVYRFTTVAIDGKPMNTYEFEIVGGN